MKNKQNKKKNKNPKIKAKKTTKEITIEVQIIKFLNTNK